MMADEFEKTVAALGLGYLYGIERKENESDDEYADRVMKVRILTRKGSDEELRERIKGEQK